jgi:parvulin-like peptidyl-prolyl isomerase
MVGRRSDIQVNLLRTRKTPYCLLVGLLAVASYAQQSVNPSSATSSQNSSPKQDSAGSDRVILKVGNLQVTKEEFESRIKAIEGQGGDPDKEETSAKSRRRLGDDYASVLMLSQQAVANNLESSPEVAQQLAIARMQTLSDAEFAALMRQAEPSLEEINHYYSAHASDYDEVRIRRLFIWKRRGNSKDGTAVSTEAARAHAEQIRKASAAGTSAEKLSEDLRKAEEGMLDPMPLTFSRGELTPEMEKVAFALKPGEWSEVDDTPSRLLLIQLVNTDRRQLGQVSSRIEKNLQGEKMQALLDDLKKKAGIWMDERYFGTAAARVTGEQWRNSKPQQSELQESAQKGGSKNENEDERQK